MSTNYYLHLKGNLLQRLDEQQEEVLHIGKSSGGWCFALHIIPERGIMCLRDWYRLFRRDRNRIFDEYDRELDIQEMLDVIMNRSWKRRKFTPNSYYHSEVDFLNKNHAQYGPNGLLRHVIGAYCYGHGPGTWDLIKGEYS